jgi:hypothetical protein
MSIVVWADMKEWSVERKWSYNNVISLRPDVFWYAVKEALKRRQKYFAGL